MGADESQPAQADEQGQAPETKNDQPQAGTEQSQADGTDDGKPTVEEHPDLKRARAEAAKYRTELRKYEKADDERKKAEMTEADKLKADRDAFEAERVTFAQSQRDFTARSQVITEAQKSGFKVSPERVFALVKGDIEFDDDGKPTNVGAVVAQLAKDEPGLVGAANGSPTNPDRQRGQGLTAADLKKMTQAEIAAMDPKVRDSIIG